MHTQHTRTVVLFLLSLLIVAAYAYCVAVLLLIRQKSLLLCMTAGAGCLFVLIATLALKQRRYVVFALHALVALVSAVLFTAVVGCSNL